MTKQRLLDAIGGAVLILAVGAIIGIIAWGAVESYRDELRKKTHFAVVENMQRDLLEMKLQVANIHEMYEVFQGVKKDFCDELTVEPPAPTW